MKEHIEELRANVDRTEMAGLTFIATRVACARAALDYIAQLEQTSRAQRTTVTECNLAAPLAEAVPAEEASDVQRDAARYRWLRDQMRFVDDERSVVMELRGSITTEHHNIHTDWQEHLWDASVDATVDAAMGIEPAPAEPAPILPSAEPTELYSAVNPYCHDLLDVAAQLDAYANFKCEAAEIRTAVESLREIARLSAPILSGGLTDEHLTAIYNDCAIKADDWSERQAREPSNIEAKGYFMRLLLSRLSTPGGQVTASDALMNEMAERLESIAQGWDGCEYEAVGETLDVGACLRQSFASLPAYLRAVGAQAPAERDAIRDEVLEEAASWIEDYQANGEFASFNDIAFDLRKLKSHHSASPDALKGGSK